MLQTPQNRTNPKNLCSYGRRRRSSEWWGNSPAGAGTDRVEVDHVKSLERRPDENWRSMVQCHALNGENVISRFTCKSLQTYLTRYSYFWKQRQTYDTCTLRDYFQPWDLAPLKVAQPRMLCCSFQLRRQITGHIESLQSSPLRLASLMVPFWAGVGSVPKFMGRRAPWILELQKVVCILYCQTN